MRLILIGASGHGKVCAEIAGLMSTDYGDRICDSILFLDDNRELEECGGYPVVRSVNDFEEYVDDNTIFFVSIGNAKARKRIQEQIEMAGGQMATLIHPNAVIGKDIEIGIGSVLMPGIVVNSGCTIGKGVIVNTSSSVDHDCRIGDYVHISVGAHVCGTVEIGDESWIGAGAIVSNNINICGGCMIGAGAVVIRDISEAGIYVGIPARRKCS